MSTYTCAICGREQHDLPFVLLGERDVQLTRRLPGGWHLCDDRRSTACPTCNPYTKNPLRTIWKKGWDAFVADQPDEPPYENHSHHGGTYGTRCNRVWQEGYRAAQENIGICEYCSQQVMPGEGCDVCGGHLDCCEGHDDDDEEDEDVQDMA